MKEKELGGLGEEAAKPGSETKDTAEQLQSGPQGLEARSAALERWTERLQQREARAAQAELELVRRSQETEARQREAEERLQQDILSKKQAMEAQLCQERQERRNQLEQEMARLRAQAEEAIASREQEARDAVEKLYRQAEEQRAQQRAQLEQEMQAEQARLDAERAAREQALQERERKLEEDREAVEQERQSISRRTRWQEREDKKLTEREETLDDLISAGIAERERTLQDGLAQKDAELDRLRRLLREQQDQLDSVRSFESAYGKSPEELMEEWRKLRLERDQAKEALSRRPSQDLADQYSELLAQHTQLEESCRQLQDANTALSTSQRETDRLRVEKETLASLVEEQKTQVAALEGMNARYQAMIQRLTAPEERQSSLEERLASIRTGGNLTPLDGERISSGASELDWLEQICRNCRDYGLEFPRRIVYAFHTALKISDWSIITVLSGVSGTGKSELPRLYAHFGGMNFINVPVQPSWDSQESMLGFFNSIDNCFEPEELLRFLVRCTEDEAYNPYMSIVLLDEMNLAHVEHYFANFLSKLETRRNSKTDDLPSVEVKLGAGVPPYLLRLERSILWTGTMNQDETTKSLSDKVLDRGLVIHFPRPKKLIGRKSMASLTESVLRSNRPLMTRGVWNEWIVRSMDLTGEQADRMAYYQNVVQQINDILEHTGRALGHRVWQSIEFYIVNYPTVRAALSPDGEMTRELQSAMDTAFEDQLVQKVMPKLRGIETRGRGREHLQAIEDLLEAEGFERLKDDFELACELGYGQFMWSSAKYIQAEEERGQDGSDQ